MDQKERSSCKHFIRSNVEYTVRDEGRRKRNAEGKKEALSAFVLFSFTVIPGKLGSDVT